MSARESNSVRLHRTIAFGDCDPAGIVYTPRILDYCVEAIDEFWKNLLGGKGWYELTLDRDRGTPFVNANLDFINPLTPREGLDITVRLARVGQTSLTFEVSGGQAAKQCFSAVLTCVIVEKYRMSKVRSDDWLLEKVRSLVEM